MKKRKIQSLNKIEKRREKSSSLASDLLQSFDNHHLLNPNTGMPVSETAGVSVIHTDPELADASATALMAAGPERFFSMVERLGLTHAMQITPDGKWLTTEALQARLQAEP